MKLFFSFQEMQEVKGIALARKMKVPKAIPRIEFGVYMCLMAFLLTFSIYCVGSYTYLAVRPHIIANSDSH